MRSGKGRRLLRWVCPRRELRSWLSWCVTSRAPAGVDDVFVFINTYRQAVHLEDPQLRMIHTIQTAGKATFFTSLTTAAAYAANVFSQVRAALAPSCSPPL